MVSKELITRMFLKLNAEKKVNMKNRTVKYTSNIKIQVSNLTLISSEFRIECDTNLEMYKEDTTI